MKALATLALALTLVGCAPLPPCPDMDCAQRRAAAAAFLQGFSAQQHQRSLMYQQQHQQIIQQMAPQRAIECQYEPVTRITRCR